MNESASHPDDRSEVDRRKTIGGLLASALNMEDQISSGVYEDYLNRAAWPKALDENVFGEIRKRLTTLIEDTTKHRKILEALAKHYGQGK